MSTVPDDTRQSLGIQVRGGWGVTGGREESLTVSITDTSQAGSFKVATQERNPQRAQMRLRKQKKGAVPFLGDFLTVLHRLDSAIPDDLDGNSNKRRKLQAVLPAGAQIPVGRQHPAVAGTPSGCWPEHRLCTILHPDRGHQGTISRRLAAQLHLAPAPQHKLLLLARIRPWDFCESGGRPFYVYFL
ncbi:PREDICTED: uncharacterized protein LOC105572741 isoform X1 [Cercocebus atys]|uniref:uncharacterized protein LOC105572741 isoform X1 n=1 Tax=Cercocebus atys TaxID=9531 RepID=UPI0005F37027|nr:PREDICTED: uncharacterized protein LOC105572741 isoform X1 [Cercocebus atys]